MKNILKRLGLFVVISAVAVILVMNYSGNEIGAEEMAGRPGEEITGPGGGGDMVLRVLNYTSFGKEDSASESREWVKVADCKYELWARKKWINDMREFIRKTPPPFGVEDALKDLENAEKKTLPDP
jgi:hypothetical protein